LLKDTKLPFFLGGYEVSEKVRPTLKNAKDKNREAASRDTELETLKKALEKERKKTDDYLNRLKYLQADFENFQKRMRKERSEAINYGNLTIIVALLPILDELELAIEAGLSNDKKNIIVKGIEMTYKKMYDILEKEGLKRIHSIGKNFDPNKHEAIEKVTTKDYKEGVVIEEIRKGFMFKERVIRPSLVKVAVTTSKEVKKDE
jgi:molecular chaperone GrpE